MADSNRRFRIWVDGRLSDRFAESLEGIDQADDAGGTVLSGDLVDESQVQGVLDQLSRLAISVRRFEIDPPPEANRKGGDTQ